MEQLSHRDRDGKPTAPDRGSSAALNAAVLADSLDVGDTPALNVIWAIVSLPFLLAALIGLVWPVARWMFVRLDYRRYMNGATW